MDVGGRDSMSRFFVAGLINIETTAAIDGFPLDYFPVRYPFFGLHTSVSGVGFNVASALHTLGHEVDFASLMGQDVNAALVRPALAKVGLSDALILPALSQTPQSVILYDPQGRRQIHVDLKDIQDQAYPLAEARSAIAACDLAVISNVAFARGLLAEVRAAGKWIATDVHALSDLDDAYNQDYLQKADILFLSDESLPFPPEDVAQQLWDRFGIEIVVVGLGDKGALLAVRRENLMVHVPAVTPRPVVNTIGAGDALFSSFLHGFVRTRDPYQALQAAVVFAGYKIGEKGAASGFLTAPELEALVETLT